MPVLSETSLRPRDELALAVVEGQNSIAGLIGPQILPKFPITRRTAHLLKATLQDTQGLRHIAGDKWIRQAGTKFERIVAKFGDANLTVELRGAEIVIPNETELDFAGYLSVESFFASKFGRETSGLTEEFLIASVLFNPANWLGGSATNSAVAYTAGNMGTNSFIADIIAATRRGKARGENYDTVVIPGPVFERVRQATLVQGYVAGTLRPGMDVSLNTIEMALREYGITKVLIGDAYYNNAADGATPSLDQIWSNTYIWVGKRGEASAPSDTDGVGIPSIAGVGVTAFWEGYTNGGVPSVDKDTQTFEGGNYVESYPDITIDSMVVRIKMSSKPAILNNRAGELIATQWA